MKWPKFTTHVLTNQPFRLVHVYLFVTFQFIFVLYICSDPMHVLMQILCITTQVCRYLLQKAFSKLYYLNIVIAFYVFFFIVVFHFLFHLTTVCRSVILNANNLLASFYIFLYLTLIVYASFYIFLYLTLIVYLHGFTFFILNANSLLASFYISYT